MPRRLSGRSAAWLARLVRDQEAGGSNPLAPTILFKQIPRPPGPYDLPIVGDFEAVGSSQLTTRFARKGRREAPHDPNG